MYVRAPLIERLLASAGGLRASGSMSDNICKLARALYKERLLIFRSNSATKMIITLLVFELEKCQTTQNDEKDLVSLIKENVDQS